MTTLQPVLQHTYPFDARGIAKRFRHAAIFAALESLDEGETMRFANDHDPLPLLEQIKHRYRDQVQAKYVERGPDGVIIDFTVYPHNAATGGGECGGGNGAGCGC